MFLEFTELVHISSNVKRYQTEVDTDLNPYRQYSMSTRALGAREEAVRIVFDVLRKGNNNFELIPFDKFNKTARLRLKHY